MRINLALKRAHICFLLALLGKRDLFQQIFNPGNHPIELTAEQSDFIIVFGIKGDPKVPSLNLLH
ncbi:hypothetical protein D3C85_1805770 [compost metagenome]